MGKGLCCSCYQNLEIRERYPRLRRPKSTTHVLGNGLTPGRVPSYPTSAMPGTAIKAMVMRLRLERGENPHHPKDARDNDKLPGVGMQHRAGWEA